MIGKTTTKNIVTYVLCTLTFWVVFLSAYILLTPIYLFRHLLKIFAKALHPEWVGMLNVRDSFLYENVTGTHGLTHSIPLLLHTVGPFSVQEFISNFQTSVMLRKDSEGRLAYEKLTYYCETWWGFPFWKRDEQFNLANHIHFTHQFQDRELTEEEIETFMGDYNSGPFQKKIPPWEILAFKRKNLRNPGEEKYSLYFRFHHILMDGFSMAQMGNLMDAKNAKEKLTSLRAKSNWRTKLVFVAKLIAFIGYDLVKLLLVDIDSNDWKLPERDLTSKMHMLSTKTVDFEVARKASQGNGVSTTAVLFGAIAGGIHEFLKAEGERMPKVMRMAVAMPVPNHPMEGMVNYWTFAMVNLPVSEPDAKKRIQKVENHLDFLKKSATTGIMWFITPFHAALPYWLVQLFANNRMSTLMGSNFPGPKNKFKFFGMYEMESFRGYLPRLRGNAAVGIASFTYDGTITFSLCVDKGLMPKRGTVRKLGDFIDQELENLSKIALTN